MTELPVTRIVRSGSGSGPLWLMVLGDEQQSTHALPSQGEVTLGRAPSSGVAIYEKSISRHHAVIRIGEPGGDDALSIEDLDSANGTRVGGDPIAPRTPTPIKQGEIVELGDISILIQRRPLAVTPRRLWSHGYFEGRLEDECARARARSGDEPERTTGRSGGSEREPGTARGSAGDDRAADGVFSLVFLHCDTRPPLEAIQATLAEVLRQIDVAGEYGAGEYEVLLVETGPAAAEERAAALVERLGRHGIAAHAGVACFPRDGRTPDELFAHASARARPVAGAGMTPSGFVVEDRAMIQLRRVIERVAGGMLSVLLLGETGVGKEVLAEEVHRRSPRKARPFLRLNCAALTETLLESELFGHEKGAFTGAISTKPGLLETANGGTVFLDEIGEISPSIQVKLLRVLEERKVMRVGALKAVPIDVRFVAATNRDLEQEVARGRFRQDLYYRLAGMTLVIPPLRERVAEIAPLAQSFIASVSAPGGHRPQLGRDTLELLEGYAWPGNIRELRNVIERAVLLCSNGVIRPEHLPMDKMRATYATYRATPAPEPRAAAGDPGPSALEPQPLDALYPGDAERDRIIATLELCRGNQTKAARILGMSRRTLIYRLERYALPRPRKRGAAPD